MDDEMAIMDDEMVFMDDEMVFWDDEMVFWTTRWSLWRTRPPTGSSLASGLRTFPRTIRSWRCHAIDSSHRQHVRAVRSGAISDNRHPHLVCSRISGLFLACGEELRHIVIQCLRHGRHRAPKAARDIFTNFAVLLLRGQDMALYSNAFPCASRHGKHRAPKAGKRHFHQFCCAASSGSGHGPVMHCRFFIFLWFS